MEIAPKKNFKIFKSSAGSGKTYTLVREYLALALSAPGEYRSILAVTFTNKAAKEMKERILSFLAALKEGEMEDLRAYLHKSAGIPYELIPSRAAALLTDIVHDYTRFSVSTIDSFTHRIVKTFARDLGISTRFDIETDQDGMLSNIVDQLLNQIGKDKYITHILSRFVLEKIGRQESWHLEADIRNVAKILFSEAQQTQTNSLKGRGQENFTAYIEFLKAKIELYPTKIRVLAQKGSDMIKNAGLEADDFPRKASGYISVFLKMEDCSKPPEFQKQLTKKYFLDAVDSEEKRTNKTGPKNAQIDALWRNGLLDVAAEMLAFHHEEYKNYGSAWFTYQNIYSLAVLKELDDLAEEYKSDNNLLTFSDFNFKIRDFVQGEEPEYLYWRLGERYRHFLLDEFQDTSRLQWDNLFPLFENNKADYTAPGSLIFVGDTKQAIYRWRGGDIHIMEEDAPAFLESEQEFLHTNYRSKPGIVRFNNEMFGQIAAHYPEFELLHSIYEDVAQKPRDPDQKGGYAQLEFLEKQSGKDPDEIPLVHTRVLTLLEELFAEQIRPSDITILVRKNPEVSEIANLLAENGIHFMASSSLYLNQAPAIQLLICLLKYLLGSKELLLVAEILTLFEKKNDRKDATPEHEGNISGNFQGDDLHERLHKKLPGLFFALSSQLNNITLYSLTEKLIHIFELAHTPNAFIMRFLDIVLEFEERYGANLAAFLEYWVENEHRFAIGLPEKGEGIKIMTVHKSKGLEFPVVIMPFVNWSLTPMKDQTIWGKNPESMTQFADYSLLPFRKDLADTWYEKDYHEESQLSLLENINLLYVSFTRARDRLYCFCNEAAKTVMSGKSPAGNMNDLLALVLSKWNKEEFDGKVLKFGEIVPLEHAEDASPAIELDEFISGQWENRLLIRTGLTEFYARRETLTESDWHYKIRQALIELSDHLAISLVTKGFVERGILLESDQDKFREELTGICIGPLKEFYKKGQSVRKNAELLTQPGESHNIDRIIVKGKTMMGLILIPQKNKIPGHAQFIRMQKAVKKTGMLLEDVAVYNIMNGQMSHYDKAEN